MLGASKDMISVDDGRLCVIEKLLLLLISIGEILR